MAAPTTVYTTANLAVMLAHPACPPMLAANWSHLTRTAANRADAIRRGDPDDAEFWRRQNDEALSHLDATLTAHAPSLLPNH
ncbi:hypothetical protein [Actinacidiphila sp. bgisy160]|uniref:hypothetical protein n=1 Tax=Actinacidiphila sp. bgisy160 TaxID=3413796 RepID=UPI003D7285CA